MSDTILVDVYQSRSLLRRKQTWRWRAVAGNGEIMASGEAYLHKQDCLDAIQQLFGTRSNVYLRQKEQGNELLRLAETAA
jgi:uncharacterized protein YegP (UPF0339 family)